MPALSAWWVKPGIRHERIEPGKPQQNGRHERMHLTLKLDAALSAPTLRKQQRVFDRFRRDYNDVRPHEALGQRPPAEFYERSATALPDPPWGRLFEYPESYELARVDKAGRLRWSDGSVFIGTVLRYEVLGLEWNEGQWIVHFGPVSVISPA